MTADDLIRVTVRGRSVKYATDIVIQQPWIFTPNYDGALVDATADDGRGIIMDASPLKVIPDVTGYFEVDLPSVGDSNGNPTGYTVKVQDPTRKHPYNISPDHTTITPDPTTGKYYFDLKDVVPPGTAIAGDSVLVQGGISQSYADAHYVTTADISGKADASALTTEISNRVSGDASKADASTVTSLATTVSGKADTSALTTETSNRTAGDALLIPLTQKDSANGVAGVDANARLSLTARPNMAPAPSGSDDTGALQSFITASITAGAPMLLPEKATYLATHLSFDDAAGVRFEGNGGNDQSSKTILRRTTSGTDSFITAHRALGLGFSRLKIENTSASYTGTLLDLAGTASPLADTDRVVVSACIIGAPSSSQATALGVDLDGTALIEFNDRTLFQWCGTAVRGCIAAGRGYANGVHFNGTHFSASANPHVKNPGNAWKFTNVIFSNLIGGLAGAVAGHDSDAPAPDGVTFDSCWFGDVTSGTNAQIEVNGNSYVTLGGFLGVGGGTGYKFTVGSTRNFTVIGVRPHGSSGFLVDLNGTSGHARMVILAQSGAGVTDFASSSIPPTGSIWMDSNGLRMRSADVVAPTTGDWMRFYQSDGTTERLAVQAAGELAWMASDGSNDAGTHILRQQTGLLRATGKFTAMAGLSVGNNASGSALGTVVNTTEIFDATGTSLGFVPIYDQITTDAPVVRTTTDQTSPDQTLITDATLQLNLRANGVYDIDGVLFYVASQTGDLQYGFSVPSGATFAWNSGGEMSTATSATGSYQFNQGGNASQVTVAGNTPTVEVSRFRGVITVGSSGGLLKLQWRQAAADATATTLKAQSFMRATKIA